MATNATRTEIIHLPPNLSATEYLKAINNHPLVRGNKDYLSASYKANGKTTVTFRVT